MIENLYKKILEEIGEDPLRDGLKDTPKRAANAIKFSITFDFINDVQ